MGAVDPRTKTYPSDVKALGPGLYEFTISTEAVDRDGDVVRASGWDLTNFRANPVVMYAHDYRSLPVGRASAIGTQGSSLVAQVQFSDAHQLARDVKALVDEGVLRSTSVGFMPTVEPKRLGDDPQGGYEFVGQELLEFSIVPIPANPEALRRAMDKGLAPALTEELVCVECGEDGKDKALDESTWDGAAALSACASSDDPAACYRAICAGRKAGDPALQSSWALPHHQRPGMNANAAGVRNALARLGQTQGLTNAAAAKAHLQAHLDNQKDALDDITSAIGFLQEAATMHQGHIEGSIPTSPESQARLADLISAALALLAGEAPAAEPTPPEPMAPAEQMSVQAQRLDQIEEIVRRLVSLLPTDPPGTSPANGHATRSVGPSEIAQMAAQASADAVAEVIRHLTGRLP